MMYSRANKGDAWFFESDHGENQNGWNYLGTYILGYQMPLFLNTVALQAEMLKYLYNTPGGDKWGDSVGRWDFGLVMNFAITERFSTLLVTQFRLYRDYKDFEYPVSIFGNKSGGVDSDLYYHEREYTDSRTLKFYRVAAVLNYKLK